jgi:hypothetical protein
MELTEEQAVRTALEGLAVAIRRSPELVPEEYLDTTDAKLEHLVYRGLDACGDLQAVTHSWYLSGVRIESETVNRAAFEAALDAVEHRGDPEGGWVGRQAEAAPEAVERYAGYFLHRCPLVDTWTADVGRYLIAFYEDEAPPDYRSLYVASQRFHNELRSTVDGLREARRAANERCGSRRRREAGEAGATVDVDRCERLGALVARYHRELAVREELGGTRALIRAFTEVVGEAYYALSEIDPDRVEARHVRAFAALRRVHYNDAWRLPALLVSVETADGPRASELRQERARALSDRIERYRAELGELREQCAAAGLTPSTPDGGVEPEYDGAVSALLEDAVAR